MMLYTITIVVITTAVSHYVFCDGDVYAFRYYNYGYDDVCVYCERRAKFLRHVRLF